MKKENGIKENWACARGQKVFTSIYNENYPHFRVAYAMLRRRVHIKILSKNIDAYIRKYYHYMSAFLRVAVREKPGIYHNALQKSPRAKQSNRKRQSLRRVTSF